MASYKRKLGARRRQMNIPGENNYRNEGVAYFPHCDGQVLEGKRLVVIGGGNSCAEAAIDLAGIVEHVTLIEFDNRLRADAALQEKLRPLANATIVTSGRTQEVQGDGAKAALAAFDHLIRSEPAELAKAT